VLRLKGLGLGGDLRVKLEVAIPTRLTETQKQAFIELAEKMDWKY
jgi:DnaJ-class molecular chaperone